MPAGERLGWYAQHFDLVEVNSTFYSVPEPRMVERWCAATPNEFTFDVKLHQLFSFHSTPAKLLPPDLQRGAETDARGNVKSTPHLREAMLKSFLRPMSILRNAGKLGVFLLQLSPAFSPRKHRAIFVNVDAPASDHFTVMPSDVDEVTNPKTAYLRLHGRNAKAYVTGKTVAARFDYDYRDKEIAEVAERSKKLAHEARDVHVIFNNNNLDYAPRSALRLRKALSQIVKTPAETLELF